MELDDKDKIDIENDNIEEENKEEENVEENEEEEFQDRDRFQITITQHIGEDIIQIENYPSLFYYNNNNFCDYFIFAKKMK